MSTGGGLLRLTGAVDTDRRAALGGKAVGLAALLRAGLTVPDTWVVPVGADPAGAELKALAGVAPRWAVRSSATVEDGAALSYAGLFRSELDVPVDDLADAIAAVRASADSDRVAAYRERTHAGSGLGVGMAVLLQPFRTPLRSGLWLGRGLGKGRLEWAAGSGDALVSGAVTPSWEEWTAAGRVGGWGLGELEAGGRPVGAACLAVQQTLGVPADLEFAVLDTGLVWLQFRPMTSELVDAVPHRAQGPGEEGRTVHGTPASSGRATGRALWVREVDDPQWEPGTVLLTEQTDPDWVPLMAEAAALVTAEGGMLCHAAIVARELGVPCVTGVGADALARLAAGGTLVVDGSAGTVSMP
ncbi:PEP-utilizing enzyme [Streptomyces sp. MP131-18]|uniref:PEP-utilizing enzyme n=1 Tax=Streptomyces sp. MP131-18 TaxID=1857892 RepID=UPI0009D0EBB1|nr:PEP-utilizing enzyme [Streptomyces sp. MP131-18]ONK10127.1 Phosphoenolpyruvate synthase [Streptomyces sp. MP131-18]